MELELVNIIRDNAKEKCSLAWSCTLIKKDRPANGGYAACVLEQAGTAGWRLPSRTSAQHEPGQSSRSAAAAGERETEKEMA
ncbi:hypothetical protein MJO28_008471 [Puccinia striiformis f. sp. tritici]|uniref:Uncharacterized protein n=1 Tax=Puccinia striiformis f. sp. tritici TaxID=168172 RepID=A0ACC0EAP8_9BASI|nr:hypothetical protein MJO28_008471 [Puccinia striiformis f. sp. tritici]